MSKKTSKANPGSKRKGEESLYAAGDFVAVYDEHAKERYSIVKLLTDVFSEGSFPADLFARGKSNQFKSEQEVDIDPHFILMSIDEESVQEVKAIKAVAAKGRGSKARVTDLEKSTPAITITPKVLKAIEAAAAEFDPPTDEEVEEDSAEEDDEEEQEKTPKKGSKSRARKSKGAMDEEDTGNADNEAMEEEEISDELEKPKKKVKGNAKNTNESEAYKKGHFNTLIMVVLKSEQLEGTSDTPNFSSSVRNSDREVIRAAKTSNKKLLEKLINSNHKISTLGASWGVENKMTPLKAIIDSGNKDFLVKLLDALKNKNNIKRAEKDNVLLKEINTGYNDEYAYGVYTRRVALSRGGRQGNNALVEDEDQSTSEEFDEEHRAYLVTSPKTSIEMIKAVIAWDPTIEADLINNTHLALLAGRADIGSFLLERAVKNGGFSLNDYYIPALTDKNDKGKIGQIMRVSVNKKSSIAGLTPLYCAGLNPNVSVLQHLLSLSPEPTVMDYYGRKLVHYAACCSSAAPMKHLISLSFDTREGDKKKKTPLMYAAHAGATEVVRVLVASNRSVPTAKDRDTCSALHYAVMRGNKDIVQLLLDAGVPVDIGGKDRMSPLHLAASQNNLDMVKFLIEKGAKLLGKDKYGRSALALAAKNGNLSVASFLLTLGADFEQPDTSGNHPLHYACAYGYHEMVDLLLRAGADPNPVNAWNLSPTTVALLKAYPTCLDRMLQDPRTNVNCIDSKGRSLVTNTVKNITEESFKQLSFLLKDKKADPNIADEKGMTALLSMVKIDVVEKIKLKQKECKSMAEREKTAHNFKSLYRKFLKILIDFGADVNARDKTHGHSGLMLALKAKNFDAIDLLLDNPQTDITYMSYYSNVFGFLNNICEESYFESVFKKVFAKAGNKAGDMLNEYSQSGGTPLQCFMNVLDRSDYIDHYCIEIEDEMCIRKQFEGVQDDVEEGHEEQDQEEDHIEENHHSKSPNGVPLTDSEKKKVQAEAEKMYEKLVSSVLSFLRMAKSKGGNFNLRMTDANTSLEVFQKNVREKGLEQALSTPFSNNLTDFDSIATKVKNIIQAKVKVDKEKMPPTSVGYNTLHEAVLFGEISYVKFLIEEAKVPVNVTSVYGETPLMSFVITRRVPDNEDPDKAILEYLLSKKCDPNIASLAGTPIQHAVELEQKIIVELLTRNKADINLKDVKGNFPLLESVKKRNLPIIEYLLQNGANPSQVDANNRNCLHWAINNSTGGADASNEVESLLLKSGCDVNALDIRGRTPVHYAFVKIGQPFQTETLDPIETISNILRRAKANIDIRDNWGNTPLNYAAQRGSVISALYLLKNGAKIDNRNNDGNTPLDTCLLEKHQNMSIFLIQKNADLAQPLNKIFLTDKKAANDKAVRLAKHQARQIKRQAEAALLETLTQDGQSKNGDEGQEEEDDNNGNRSRKKAKPIKKKSDSDDEDEPEVEENIFIGKPDSDDDFNSNASVGGQSEDEEEDEDEQDENGKPKVKKIREKTGNAGKKKIVHSKFKIAITNDWQSVAFLMLEYGFELVQAIIDCFDALKFNYVYTLLTRNDTINLNKYRTYDGRAAVHALGLASEPMANDPNLCIFDKILGIFIDNKADFDVTTAEGWTALHYASSVGYIEAIDWPYSKNFDINKPTKKGETVLGLFLEDAIYDHLGQKLVEDRKTHFDFNKPFVLKNKKHTMLTYIFTYFSDPFEYLDTLVAAGANINLPDEDGWTPLTISIRANKTAFVKRLLKDFKADPKIIDNEGNTLIHHVVRPRKFGYYENEEIMKLLLPLVDFNKANKSGFTPLDYAREMPGSKLAKLLEEKKAKATGSQSTQMKRVKTSIINELDFPTRQYNYLEDYEKFIKSCRQESGLKKEEFDGKVGVDPNATGNYEVVYENGVPFDLYMVKVNIKFGKYSYNTFYKMQILQEKATKTYTLFTKWGRSGTDGQFQQTPFSKLEDAKKEFCKIFKSKSGNDWESKNEFKKMKNKYRLITFVQPNNAKNFIKAFNFCDPKIPASHLDPSIYGLMRRACNYKVIVSAMREEDIDTRILPPHAIDRKLILEAEEVLKEITKKVEQLTKIQASTNPDVDKILEVGEEITNLSNDFHELIPSKLAAKTGAVQPIMSSRDVEEKKKVVANLLNYEIAIKLLGAATYNMKKVNPMDYCFNCLSSKVQNLDPSSEEYEVMKQYTLVHPNVSKHKDLISNIYAIERSGERDGNQKWDNKANRKLLFHGTAPENIVGILQTGFRVAPSESSGSGHRLGVGLYFSDQMRKSYNYTTSATLHLFNYFNENVKSLKEPKKYIFICEVILGNSKLLFEDTEVKDVPNNQFQSVLGVGQSTPDPQKDIYLMNGSVVPLGDLISNPIKNKNKSTNFGENEYVVYDPTQVRIKYLLELRDRYISSW